MFTAAFIRATVAGGNDEPGAGAGVMGLLLQAAMTAIARTGIQRAKRGKPKRTGVPIS
ncbi:MAG: hypothetical protein ABI431_08745 [Candidatus Tumulicola sp.]